MAENIQKGMSGLSINDEDSIDGSFMSSIARLLRDDWKLLGMHLGLNDYELDQINIDEKQVYDKAYETLKRWKQQSPVDVTRTMLKSHLREIHRNDIILDVFERGGGGVKNNERTKISAGGTNYNMDSSPTISSLTLKNKKELQNMLDPDHGIGIRNWYHLGLEITNGNPDLSAQVKSLHLHYAGGGNPAMTFFAALSTRYPETTLEKFRDIAATLERNDIVFYIKKITDFDTTSEFRNLPYEHQEKIAGLLNMRAVGVYDWQFFAEEFGFHRDDIESFRVAIKSENSYSPTGKLLDLVKAYKPEMKLQELVTICEKMKRNDVAKLLKDIIKEADG